jgi:hypothetical protein
MDDETRIKREYREEFTAFGEVDFTKPPQRYPDGALAWPVHAKKRMGFRVNELDDGSYRAVPELSGLPELRGRNQDEINAAMDAYVECANASDVNWVNVDGS